MSTVEGHIAFTEAIRDIQERKGSREAYARYEEMHPLRTEIDEELAAFIARQRSVFMATTSSSGQPYIQHRGGPPGFLNVLDAKTIVFADYKGNQQFVSQGNLTENAKAFLFLIDYRHRIRIKVWGTATVREDQPEELARQMENLGDYRARPEQIIYFHVEAWEVNCKQHIPVRYDEEEVQQLLKERDARIEALERQLASLIP